MRRCSVSESTAVPGVVWAYVAPSQLRMTEEELRRQLRNAGFGKGGTDTFLIGGGPLHVGRLTARAHTGGRIRFGRGGKGLRVGGVARRC